MIALLISPRFVIKSLANMNIKTPHIRFAPLSALILLGLFAILRPASATPDLAETVAASMSKMNSRCDDFDQLISSNLIETDRNAAIPVASVADLAFCNIERLRELLLIAQSARDENDRRMVEGFISHDIDALARFVDIQVKYINRVSPTLHNQALLLAATKLRDDLRELKNLPKPGR